MDQGHDNQAAAAGEAPSEQAPQAGDVPVAVFADTLPAPVPSVSDDGHPVELGAPQAIRPKWIDRVLGKVLGKAVASINPGSDRMPT